MDKRLIRSSLLIACLLATPATTLADCEPTPRMPLGTHYKEGAKYKVDIGAGLIIKGRVLAMPNCTAIAHARIEHWQADAQGYYVDKLRAYLLSDQDGGFSFKTEWPGARIPHIHFMVTAEGYNKLVTQWIGSKRVSQRRLDLVLQKKQVNNI